MVKKTVIMHLKVFVNFTQHFKWGKSPFWSNENMKCLEKCKCLWKLTPCIIRISIIFLYCWNSLHFYSEWTIKNFLIQPKLSLFKSCFGWIHHFCSISIDFLSKRKCQNVHLTLAVRQEGNFRPKHFLWPSSIMRRKSP